MVHIRKYQVWIRVQDRRFMLHQISLKIAIPVWLTLENDNQRNTIQNIIYSSKYYTFILQSFTSCGSNRLPVNRWTFFHFNGWTYISLWFNGRTKFSLPYNCIYSSPKNWFTLYQVFKIVAKFWNIFLFLLNFFLLLIFMGFFYG